LLRLTGKEKVLEVGAGSGYQTALLATMASVVFAVERVTSLAYGARAALEAAGISNVTVLVGDGTLGWRSCAPFDAIVVAAASPEVPAPLLEQLSPHGRLVIPLGRGDVQGLTLIERRNGDVVETHIADVRFVPLIGRHGLTES
jgi:protein-L-isoaspartate(D-aspartate) O-methyltransferase